MKALFSLVLNMSLTGSVVIALVLAARLLLKRAPKIYSYALWGVVLFRLLCPVSLSSSVSPLGWLRPKVTETTPVSSMVSYLPGSAGTPTAQSSPRPEQTGASGEPAKAAPDALELLSWVWLAGAASMGLYSLAQYLLLRRGLVGAAPCRERVYLTDYVDTPFVLGVVRPRVYLPSRLSQEERRFILAHERCHIRRRDPLWKLLGYLALCVHWFNPLVWAAFLMAGKDMEMSCDEAVIRQLGEHIRADYSASLLRLSTRRTALAGMPLAFGEGDPKGRVKNMARWKKPKVWASVLCAALCLCVLAVCAVNPKRAGAVQERVTGPAQVEFGPVKLTVPQGFTYELLESGQEADLSDGSRIVGGVTALPMPEGQTLAGWDWLNNLDLWEWEDESLGSFADSGQDGKYTLEFFSDVPEGVEREVLRLHILYPQEDWVYDVWFDELAVDEAARETILGAAGGETHLPYQIQALPQGYSCVTEEDGHLFFTHDGQIVGGITDYPIPKGVYDPDDAVFTWLEEVGIPDYEDENLTFYGGISDFRGGWKVTFGSDSPAVRRTHTFQAAGNVVYDFWLDELLLDEQTQFAIQDAVHFLQPEAIQGEQPPEETIRETIRRESRQGNE